VTEHAYWGPQPDATLEWTLSNPPPAHTFETLPTPDMWDHRGAH
jgi:cytochrome c oxidase subunit 1